MADSTPTFWTSTLLANEPGLVHAVTKGCWNMSRTTGSSLDTTDVRRRRVCEILSVPFERLTTGRQVHGTKVAVRTPSRDRKEAIDDPSRDRKEAIANPSRPDVRRDKGALAINADNLPGNQSPEPIPGVDGLVTDEPNVPLMVLSADCCLMVLYDPARPAVGVAHAGWRGTAGGLAGELVRAMSEAFQSRPEHFLAAMSPCAGACCYEVQEDVVAVFEENRCDLASVLERRDGSTFLNLTEANALQLESAGVTRDRIDVANICTVCSEDYFSYRRDGPSTGHFALIAAIR